MDTTFDMISTFKPATAPVDDRDDVVARLALIKPPGKGDSGMAEERG